MNVFINKNIPEAGIKLLQEKGINLTINPTENVLSREEFIKICQQNDALLNVGTNNLDEDFFQQCPNLKGIALFSVGFDSVNIPSANSRKIPVGNTPDVLSRATSDVAFLLMQSVARKSFFNHKRILNDDWGSFDPLANLGQELYGKTLGIFGLGRIGFENIKRNIIMFKILNDLNLINSILRKGGVVFILKLIAMPISFFAYWFIPNKFGEADLGLFTLALTILQVSYLIFALGLPHAFLAFTGGFENNYLKKGFLLKSSLIALVVSLIPFCILFFGSGFIASTIFKKEDFSVFLSITAVAIPFMILHEILCYFFISVGKHFIYSLLLFIIPNVLFSIFLVVSSELNLPSYSVFLSYVLGFFITVIIGYLLAFSKELKFIIPKISTYNILKKENVTFFLLTGIILT